MLRKLKRIGICVIVMMMAVGLLSSSNFVSAVVPGINERVSLRSTGAQASAATNQAFISPNNKIVAFKSSATNILPSGGAGLFERNLATGSIARVNVSTTGVIGDEIDYTSIERVSSTGRYIVFHSRATNLIDGVTISASNQQVYLRDTTTSTTVLISQSSAGAVANAWSESIGVSSDGRFVGFVSNASNLHPDSTDGESHLYMLDRSDNSLTILDRKADGTLVHHAWRPRGAMSCDGSLVVFQYGANLIAGDTDSNHVDIYLLDRRGTVNKLTNLTKTANSAATVPSISCNGDFIGFQSAATNIDPLTPVTFKYNAYRPYIYDRVNDTYNFAAITTSNTPVTTAVCTTFADATYPCIQLSDTGVGIFAANDSTLTGSSGTQVYIRDIYAGTTQLVSKNSSGIAGNGNSSFSYLTADGTTAIYSSDSTNLVSGDTNNVYDVFTSQTGY